MSEQTNTAVEDIEPLSNSLPLFTDWLPNSLVPVWQIVSNYPIVGGLIIAVLFYLIAIVIGYVVFDNLKRLTEMTASAVDNILIDSLRGPVMTTIIMFGLCLAVQAAALPVGTELTVNLILSVIVLKWMRVLLQVATAVLATLEQEERFTLVEARTIPLFDLTSKLLIILLGSYILLMVWSINPLGWLASAGIVGIAVGFAAKDTLANLFAGFFIVADAPYKIGDYINLDSGERGQVTAIGLRSTRILTRDDVEITVPNGVIANGKIINESGGPSTRTRLRVIISVAYGSDVEEVCAILQKIGDEHPETCSHPGPRVRMRGFGASGLNFELLCWIDSPPNRGRVSHELNIEVYNAFAANGIEIPYAKTDLYIKEWPDSAAGD